MLTATTTSNSVNLTSLWLPLPLESLPADRTFTLAVDGTVVLNSKSFSQETGLLYELADTGISVYKKPGAGRDLFVYQRSGEIEVFRFSSIPSEKSPRWRQYHTAGRLGSQHETELLTLGADGAVSGRLGTPAESLSLSVASDTARIEYAAHYAVQAGNGVLTIRDRYGKLCGKYRYESGEWYELSSQAFEYLVQIPAPVTPPLNKRLQVRKPGRCERWLAVRKAGHLLSGWLKLEADGTVVFDGKTYPPGSTIPETISADGVATLSSPDTARRPLLLADKFGQLQRFRYRNGLWERRVIFAPYEPASDEFPCRFCADGSLLFADSKPQPLVIPSGVSFTIETPKKRIHRPDGEELAVDIYDQSKELLWQFLYRRRRWYQLIVPRKPQQEAAQSTLRIARSIPPQAASIQIGPVELFHEGFAALRTLSGTQAYQDGEPIDLALDPQHRAYRPRGYCEWLQVLKTSPETGEEKSILSLAYQAGGWYESVPLAGDAKRLHSLPRHYDHYGVFAPISWSFDNLCRVLVWLIFGLFWLLNAPIRLLLWGWRMLRGRPS